MSNPDVLIVGAGPVGLNLGLCLLKQGLSFRIIDKKSGPTTSSNAVGVNCRTMEVWESLGFIDEAIKRGLKVHGTSLYSDSELLNQVKFDLIESKHDFMLALPQAHTEKLLLEELAKNGITVDWEHELTSINQSPEDVTVAIKHNEKDEEFSYRWVVGCDGYRSSVRDLSGLTRACHDLPLHFLMVDAVVSGEISTSTVNILFHDKGMIFMIPMRDSIRVVVEISTDEEYKHLKTCEPDIFREIIAKRYPKINIGRVDWSSAFYIHECLADNYRNGRIFIAGDASHTHSPMGGQGMNTGIQDTWNLAWKLGQVKRGEAADTLLDSYSLERRAIGHDVLERSGKLTTMATTTNPILKRLRNFGIHHLADWDIVRSKVANGLSQSNICYENSPLVKHEQVRKSGQLKYPEYQGDKWTLLTLEDSNDQLPSYIRMINVNQLPLHAHYCLIRPDGYTAMYANDIAEIFEYFRKNHFNLK